MANNENLLKLFDGRPSEVGLEEGLFGKENNSKGYQDPRVGDHENYQVKKPGEGPGFVPSLKL